MQCRAPAYGNAYDVTNAKMRSDAFCICAHTQAIAYARVNPWRDVTKACALTTQTFPQLKADLAYFAAVFCF